MITASLNSRTHLVRNLTFENKELGSIIKTVFQPIIDSYKAMLRNFTRVVLQAFTQTMKNCQHCSEVANLILASTYITYSVLASGSSYIFRESKINRT